MMAEKKRQCGTCRFFKEKDAGGHGKCTHPKRAGTDADLLLLRPTELACRTKWGDSLWQDPEDESDPMKPQSPQQPTLPEPIAAQLQFDDEVTSVSIAGSKSSRSSFEDDVVDSGATATGMASWNDPVQEERLDLLRKSSHDALAGARKRHMEKQARQRELIPFAEDDEAKPAAQSNPEAAEEQPLTPARERRSIFPPDDFVENENSAGKEDTAIDDEMVDEGVSPDRHRSPRMRKLLREPNNPKKNEAMRMSMPSEIWVTSNNPDNRTEWETVPVLDPAFELPRSKPRETTTSADRLTAHTAPTISSSYQARTISQAREVKSEVRIRNERAQRQMVAPILDTEAQKPQPAPSPSMTSRPRITEEPPRSAAPIDRLKSSPLRGYRREAPKMSVSEPGREQNQQQITQAYQEAPGRQRADHTRPSPTRYDANPNSRGSYQESAQPQSRQIPRRETRPAAQPEMRRDLRPEQPHQEVEQRRASTIRRSYAESHDMNAPFEREEIEISPNVPRRCGTCSSYKASGVEGRGSCTNRFAGPAQRVVNDQDLACNHTHGSLWLPADERVWLKVLKTKYPPTPRVDAMLARRRRRENPVLPDLDELTS